MTTKNLKNAADLGFDPKNANRGTKRGRTQLEKSLRDFGAGRSILLDKNNVAIAGNKTLEEAKRQGYKVRVIQTDGTELVAVQRMDLDLKTDKRAKGLAVADNRVAELDLDWDADILKGLGGELDLGDVGFSPADLKRLGLSASDETPAVEMKSGFSIMIEDLTEQQQLEWVERLTKEGLKCRALTF